MEFYKILEKLKSVKEFKATRKGWNGKGMWIELQTPDENSKMTIPYIYIVIPKYATNQLGEHNREVNRIPWLPSQTDMFADDWIIQG